MHEVGILIVAVCFAISLRAPRRSRAGLLAVFVLGALVVSGPQIAIAAFDAVNADKVDGRHAVHAGTSRANRAGKLVATNADGNLPGNIIALAPDANRLDGLDSTAFQRRVVDPCAAGHVVTGVAADGALACAVDNVNGGNADTLDALNSSAFEREPSRTVVVGPVGTPTQNGSALRAALAAIPTTGETAPSVDNHWLLKIEPGHYRVVNATRFVMRQFVDVEGSGPGTVLTCTCGSAFQSLSATLSGAPSSSIRSLKVVNTGSTTTHAIGIHGAATASIRDVVIEVSGATDTAYGIRTQGAGRSTIEHAAITVSGAPTATGIEATSEQTTIIDSNIAALGMSTSRGINIFNAADADNAIRDTEVSATGGTTANIALRNGQDGITRVDGSSLRATGQSSTAITLFLGTVAHVSATLIAAPLQNSGTIACVGAFNAAYVALNATCQ